VCVLSEFITFFMITYNSKIDVNMSDTEFELTDSRSSSYDAR